MSAPQPPPPAGLVWDANAVLAESTTRITTLLGSLLDPADTRSRADIPVTEALSVHLVRFGPSPDAQQPHQQDEIYYVLRGRSKFTVGPSLDAPTAKVRTVDVQPGTLLFVAARNHHRFHDFELNERGERQVETLVVFGPNYTG